MERSQSIRPLNIPDFRQMPTAQDQFSPHLYQDLNNIYFTFIHMPE
jgi:hypothetical protein